VSNRTLVTLVLFQLHTALYPQVFPVRVRVYLTQPAPSGLYQIGEEGRLRVEIYPADLTLSHYPVLLRMTLTGDRVSFVSGGRTLTLPFYLNGGEMLVLTGEDLSAWFSADNLQISGMSRSAFLQNPFLPEGFYSLSFEVLDFYRRIPVSSCVPALFMVSLNEPPELNQPQNGEEIPWRDPQEVFFSWSPRHNPLSYAGFMPQYTLQLWEVLQEGRHPEDVIRRQPPMVSITCTAPFYRYSLSDPLLTPGKTYVWQVKAEDPQHKTGFSNEGCSRAFRFRYALPCRVPELTVSSTAQNTVHLRWEPAEEHRRYLIQFRQYVPPGKEDAPDEWNTLEAEAGKAMVDRLRENSDYEFRLVAFCSSQEPVYSAPVVARTARREFRC